MAHLSLVLLCFSCLTCDVGAVRFHMSSRALDNSSAMEALAQNQHNDAGVKEYETFSNSVFQGVVAVKDGIRFANDQNLKNAGNALISIGGLVSVAVPPPAGIMVGGVLSLAGGIMGISAPHAATNQDILDALTNGLAKIGSKLNGISYKLDKIQSGLSSIRKTTTDIKEIVTANYFANRMEPFFEIHGAFQAAMRRLEIAVKHPAELGDFVKYVRDERSRKASYDGAYFGLSEIKDIMDVVIKNIGDGGRCRAASVYRDIVAARFELFWILYMGSVFKSDSCHAGESCFSPSPISLQYAEDLRTTLEQYDKHIVDEYEFEESFLKASPAQIKFASDKPLKIDDAVVPYSVPFWQTRASSIGSDCPSGLSAIPNHDICKTAARALDKAWFGVVEYLDGPFGCVVNHDVVYFQNKRSGAASSDPEVRLLCFAPDYFDKYVVSSDHFPCDVHLTSAECRAAAAKEGLTFNRMDTWSDQPKGCFWNHNNQFSFNEHAVGLNPPFLARAKPVCKRASLIYIEHPKRIGCHDGKGNNLGFIGRPKDFDFLSSLATLPSKCTRGDSLCRLKEEGIYGCDAANNYYRTPCIGFGVKHGSEVQLYGPLATNKGVCDKRDGLLIKSAWTTYLRTLATSPGPGDVDYLHDPIYRCAFGQCAKRQLVSKCFRKSSAK